MLKILKKYYGLFISALLIILFAAYIYTDTSKLKEYHADIHYLNVNINIKLYSKNASKAKQTLKELEKIYIKYDQLIDRNQTYNDIHNLYYIRNNKRKSADIEINEDLYKVLAYGKEVYKKSNYKININTGAITDIWGKYFQNKKGFPSENEFVNVNTDINEIELLDNHFIKNNHPNIDLSLVVKGYVASIVKDYLEKEGMDQYLINMGGNITAGKCYQKGTYKLGLQDASTGEYYQFLKVEGQSVVSKSTYDDYYDYNKKRYHHILDFKEHYPVEYMKSVTVITKDPKRAETIATILFMMPVSEGKNYIQSEKNIDVIWYQNDGTITSTNSITKYK